VRHNIRIGSVDDRVVKTDLDDTSLEIAHGPTADRAKVNEGGDTLCRHAAEERSPYLQLSPRASIQILKQNITSWLPQGNAKTCDYRSHAQACSHGKCVVARRSKMDRRRNRPLTPNSGHHIIIDGDGPVTEVQTLEQRDGTDICSSRCWYGCRAFLFAEASVIFHSGLLCVPAGWMKPYPSGRGAADAGRYTGNAFIT